MSKPKIIFARSWNFSVMPTVASFWNFNWIKEAEFWNDKALSGTGRFKDSTRRTIKERKKSWAQYLYSFWSGEASLETNKQDRYINWKISIKWMGFAGFVRRERCFS